MKNLKVEIETKLNQAENVYGTREYCLSLASEKETISKVSRIKKLGYIATKNQTNHYTISE